MMCEEKGDMRGEVRSRRQKRERSMTLRVRRRERADTEGLRWMLIRKMCFGTTAGT